MFKKTDNFYGYTKTFIIERLGAKQRIAKARQSRSLRDQGIPRNAQWYPVNRLRPWGIYPLLP